MNVKLPGLVELVRRDVILSEDAAFDAMLSEPSPCDGCPWREQCAHGQVACKAFVAFIHGKPEAWVHYPRTQPPTHEYYEQAMAAEPPEWLEQRKQVSAQTLVANAREWMGRVVDGGEVVGVLGRGSGTVLQVRCSKCGRETKLRPGEVATWKCLCGKNPRLTASNRAAAIARWKGKELQNGWTCVAVEFTPKAVLVVRHGPTGIVERRSAARVASNGIAAPERSRRRKGQYAPGSALDVLSDAQAAAYQARVAKRSAVSDDTKLNARKVAAQKRGAATRAANLAVRVAETTVADLRLAYLGTVDPQGWCCTYVDLAGVVFEHPDAGQKVLTVAALLAGETPSGLPAEACPRHEEVAFVPERRHRRTRSQIALDAYLDGREP